MPRGCDTTISLGGANSPCRILGASSFVGDQNQNVPDSSLLSSFFLSLFLFTLFLSLHAAHLILPQTSLFSFALSFPSLLALLPVSKQGSIPNCRANSLGSLRNADLSARQHPDVSVPLRIRLGFADRSPLFSPRLCVSFLFFPYASRRFIFLPNSLLVNFSPRLPCRPRVFYPSFVHLHSFLLSRPFFIIFPLSLPEFKRCASFHFR